MVFSNTETDYKIKYLKYKNKYLELKNSLNEKGGAGIYDSFFGSSEPKLNDIVVYKFSTDNQNKCGILFYFVKFSDDKKTVLLKDKKNKTAWRKYSDISLLGKQGKDYIKLDPSNPNHWGDFQYNDGVSSNATCN
jgi:hypothetical protein